MSGWLALLWMLGALMALAVAFLAGALWGSRGPRPDEMDNAVADAYAWGRADEAREWEARPVNGHADDEAPTAATPGWIRRDLERR